MYKKIKSNLKNYTFSTILELFRSWLRSQSYTSTTIRNYLSDVNKYFQFLLQLVQSTFAGKTLNDIESAFIFTNRNLQDYLVSVSSDKQFNRYLSSLSQFFLFAKDQQLIVNNPFFKIKKIVTQNKTNCLNQFVDTSFEKQIIQYRQYLAKQNLASSNINKYIKDLREYINWHSSLVRP